MNGVKTCGIIGKDALTGDWEGLNKETYIYIYIIYVYKRTQRFTYARKYKLIKLLTFISVPYETDVGKFFGGLIMLFSVFLGNCCVLT